MKQILLIIAAFLLAQQLFCAVLPADYNNRLYSWNFSTCNCNAMVSTRLLQSQPTQTFSIAPSTKAAYRNSWHYNHYTVALREFCSAYPITEPVVKLYQQQQPDCNRSNWLIGVSLLVMMVLLGSLTGDLLKHSFQKLG